MHLAPARRLVVLPRRIMSPRAVRASLDCRSQEAPGLHRGAPLPRAGGDGPRADPVTPGPALLHLCRAGISHTRRAPMPTHGGAPSSHRRRPAIPPPDTSSGCRPRKRRGTPLPPPPPRYPSGTAPPPLPHCRRRSTAVRATQAAWRMLGREPWMKDRPRRRRSSATHATPPSPSFSGSAPSRPRRDRSRSTGPQRWETRCGSAG